jgi:hypothetical protein
MTILIAFHLSGMRNLKATHLQNPVFRHRALIGGIEKIEYQELP